MSELKSIYREAMDELKKGKTLLEIEAYESLNREEIADIVQSGNIFWFEYYINGTHCSIQVIEYLKCFIQERFKLEYLYDKYKI